MHDTSSDDAQPVELLWTSGWDSTFRLASLVLLEHRTVQPWYVVDPDRRSRHIEIRTMEILRANIAQADGAAGARILPTKFVGRAAIPANREITKTFKAMRTAAPWAPQYEWLARLADSQPHLLELCIKCDGTATERLLPSLERRNDVHRFGLSDTPQSSDHLIFRRFAFPLADLTKVQMQELSIKYGFEDILAHTWFCQHPTLVGTTCGLCVPCRNYILEGFGDRVPQSHTTRQRLEFHVVNKGWGVYTRFRRHSRRAVHALISGVRRGSGNPWLER